MARKVTRREALKFAGGTALGLLLTPVPWKLVADSALWTQNGPMATPLPRGPVSFRRTACPLCPLGCAVTARCIGGVPVSLAGVEGDPAGGSLCAAGFGGHQLPWHPALRRTPRRRVSGGSWKDTDAATAASDVADAIRGRAASQLTVILDDRPGRARSETYRAFAAAIPGGVYVPSPGRPEILNDAIAAAFEPRFEGSVTIDPLAATTILTLGAPLFDGFGGPGTAARLLDARRDSRAPVILAAESRLTRTASFADRWYAIRPGSEPVLALAIARVVIMDGLVPADRLAQRAVDLEAFRSLVDRVSPGEAAEITGVGVPAITEIARALAAGPSLVTGGDPAAGPAAREDLAIIAGLNLLLSAARSDSPLRGTSGLPFASGGAPPAALSREWTEIPDRSVRVLILDASDGGAGLPWSAVTRKLAPVGSVVVSLSPWPTGLSRRADLVVPAPADYEAVEELVSAGPFGPARRRLSLPLVEGAAAATDPAAFLHAVAGACGRALPGTPEDFDASADRLFERGRGRIVTVGGEDRPLSDVLSAEALRGLFGDGAVWIDDDAVPLPERFRLAGPDPARLVRFVEESRAAGLRAARSAWVVSAASCRVSGGGATAVPLLTKVGRESGLRDVAPDVLVNPVTAREHRLAEGAAIRVDTERGTMSGRVHFDMGVRPGAAYAVTDEDGIDDTRPADDGILDAGDPAARVLVAAVREA